MPSRSDSVPPFLQPGFAEHLQRTRLCAHIYPVLPKPPTNKWGLSCPWGAYSLVGDPDVNHIILQDVRQQFRVAERVRKATG